MTETGGSGTLDTKADFYVSPAGEAIEGKYESWIGRNRRDEMMGKAQDPVLKTLIGEAYFPDSVIGDGSLADAIQFERNSGIGESRNRDRKAGDLIEYFNLIQGWKQLDELDQWLISEMLRKLKNCNGRESNG